MLLPAWEEVGLASGGRGQIEKNKKCPNGVRFLLFFSFLGL
jgi:hypothetical protein